MSVANCGHDENYTYWNGKAGDQNGTEWEIKDWYNYSGGWTHVIRFENPEIASMIAQFAIAAAMNNHIGYDRTRDTLSGNSCGKSAITPQTSRWIARQTALRVLRLSARQSDMCLVCNR